MLLKIIGGILIIAASGLLGLLYSAKLSIRYVELNNIRRYMQMLETEIAYGAIPLPAALTNVSNKAAGLTGSFFLMVAEGLSDRSYYSFSDAWTFAAESIYRDSPLKEADIALLKSFGYTLGSSDREDQRKHFELFYVQLKHQLDLAKEELQRSGRMYKSLGFLLGIAVFVVLV